MEFHNVSEINNIVSTIPFVKVLVEFNQSGVIVNGKVGINDINGLNNDLEFDVEIYPQYPLKVSQKVHSLYLKLLQQVQ